jgi:hypothetical protein
MTAKYAALILIPIHNRSGLTPEIVAAYKDKVDYVRRNNPTCDGTICPHYLQRSRPCCSGQNVVSSEYGIFRKDEVVRPLLTWQGQCINPS